MATVSKLDYLKKYMSSENQTEEKRLRKKKKRIKDLKNIMIIDNDVKFNDNKDKNTSDDGDEFDLEEEKPLVYIDGKTLLSEHNEKKEKEGESRWAPVPIGNMSSRALVDKQTSKSRSNVDDISSVRSRHSPVQNRFKKRHDSPEKSAQKIRKSRSGSSDLSPERPRARSPVGRKRQRHDSPDVSPSRRSRKQSSPDLSPVRNRRESSSSDLSPERSKKRGIPDYKKRQRHDSPDMSPPRNRRRQSSAELSPNKSDYRQRKSKCSPDLSPERREKKQKVEIKKERHEASPEVVASGKKSGLQSAKSLREENVRTKRLEDQRYAAMEKTLSGKGATTIYRDKSGKKIDLDEEKRKRDEIERKKAEENIKYDQWKKGLTQQDEYTKKLEEDLIEMSKPLARYKDDKDLDELLKQQEREEDPMLAFIKKTKSNEKKKEKPRYKGRQPPPNRFNIWPGYRWDGVDRSNGFEKKRFALIAERQSISVDAYKWSVEDM